MIYERKNALYIRSVKSHVAGTARRRLIWVEGKREAVDEAIRNVGVVLAGLHQTEVGAMRRDSITYFLVE